MQDPLYLAVSKGLDWFVHTKIYFNPKVAATESQAKGAGRLVANSCE